MNDLVYPIAFALFLIYVMKPKWAEDMARKWLASREEKKE